MGSKYAKWIALFSQTGQELIDISEKIDRQPDVIISNSAPELCWRIRNRFPQIDFYSLTTFGPEAKSLDILDTLNAHEPLDDTLITLNGWLRIVPPNKCSKYNIFNGHPGLITDFPELKGKDPQERAYTDLHKYDKVGSVVHRVVAEVDAGEIEEVESVSTANILTLDEMHQALRNTSLLAWERFLNKSLDNNV